MGDLSFTYFEPSNDRTENVTAEQVLASMREDPAFARSYSPVGQLHGTGPGRPTLFFVRHPRRGWYVEYDAPAADGTNERRQLVAVDPEGDRDAWVEHWAEGETEYFLAACFLPEADAEQAVRDFLASGEPSPSLAWEALRWDLHRREGPPEDESRVVEEAADPE